MWANAQRDGRPAEHRWRPLFNAANAPFLSHPLYQYDDDENSSDLWLSQLLSLLPLLL